MSQVRSVSEEWAAWPGSPPAFARSLDRRGVPYISFSHLASLDACQYRYYLEYVEGVRPFPEPSWAVKGRLFHEAAARVFRARAKGRRPRMGQIRALVEKRVFGDSRAHLLNALETLLRTVEPEWEVVGVESPFVLEPGDGVPPVLGIMDLVLRKGDTFAVVDHKTCRSFGEPDPLQLTIYREQVRREHGARLCLAWYDEYRWVADLARIRKPATRRTLLAPRKNGWRDAKRRLARAWGTMERIRRSGEARGNGNCFPCPHRDDCPKADLGGGGWW